MSGLRKTTAIRIGIFCPPGDTLSEKLLFE